MLEEMISRKDMVLSSKNNHIIIIECLERAPTTLRTKTGQTVIFK